MKWFRDRALTLVLMAMFLVFLAGQLVTPIRFRCLNTTDGPGDDELEFTIRFASANGQEKAVTSRRYEDIDQGYEDVSTSSRFNSKIRRSS